MICHMPQLAHFFWLLLKFPFAHRPAYLIGSNSSVWLELVQSVYRGNFLIAIRNSICGIFDIDLPKWYLVLVSGSHGIPWEFYTEGQSRACIWVLGSRIILSILFYFNFPTVYCRVQTGIEKLVLDIWLMKDMIVSDLNIVHINWTVTPRCRCTFPCNTFIAIWKAPSEQHQKSGPGSMSNVWCSRLW